MSHLDLPRIQFGGLFFTNPDTLNNYIRSYDPSTQIENAQGQFVVDPPPSSNQYDGGPAGWNALGVAQLWLEQCSVLSAVDDTGATIAADDPIVGTAVESPSPKTPKSAPDGTFFDLAKLVDLDPDQQGRSAVYGLRLFLTLPGGGGFSGLVSVPELQYMGPRIPVRGGSWTAVGTWMGQITDVAWSGDVAESPLLQAFQQACAGGIAVKLAMDLHQNDPGKRFTAGDMFCYGRVLGSLGPLLPGELAQVVPGRMVVTEPAAAPHTLEMAAPAGDAAAQRSFRPMTIDARFRAGGSGHSVVAAEGDAAAGLLAEATPAAATPAVPWNPAPAVVRATDGGTILHLDLGSSIPLQLTTQGEQTTSNGQFQVSTGIAVGYLDAAGTFQPFAQGQVSFANQYQLLSSMSKQCYLVRNSGIVDVPLNAAEAAKAASRPLAVTAAGATMLAEPASGLFLATSPLSLRLAPGQSATIQLMARQFGQPLVGQQPVTWQGQIYAVDSDTGQLIPSDDVEVAWDGSTDADGLATLTVTASSQAVTLPSYRQPLDSWCYYVFLLGADGQAIGDGSLATLNPNVSVLRFQAYSAPASPTWANDVAPILQAYARLYPGMRDKLDIGDQATVTGFAGAMLARMGADFADPTYMPVTRDLSPAKVTMICDWLRAQLPPTP